MAIPQWLIFTIAGLVILFGVYRMWLAVAGPSDEERAKHRRGMLAMGRRTHGLVAIMFFIVGALAIASGFGWKPFTSKAADTAPASPARPGSALPLTP